MLKQSCMVCKIVGALAIIGALNWGLVALFNVNLVEQVLGADLAKWAYILVGISGVLLLVSYVYVCPGCRTARAAA